MTKIISIIPLLKNITLTLAAWKLAFMKLFIHTLYFFISSLIVGRFIRVGDDNGSLLLY